MVREASAILPEAKLTDLHRVIVAALVKVLEGQLETARKYEQR